MKEEILFKEELISVDFDYQPEEPMTKWEPGCHEDFEDILINGIPEDWFKENLINELKEELSNRRKR